MDCINSFLRRRTIQAIFPIFLVLTVLTYAEAHDAKRLNIQEGGTIHLQCRFPPTKQNTTYLWIRHADNQDYIVAAEGSSFVSNYRVIGKPEAGRYDLKIMNVSYERDDGIYECRVKLAVAGTDLHCQITTLVVLGAPGVRAQSGAFASPTLIALVVSGAFLLLLAALLLLFCRCRRKHAAKAEDSEMDSNAVRPSLVTVNGQQTQASPPYDAENKAPEHSLELALAPEDPNSPADRDAQPGYGYHQPNHNINDGGRWRNRGLLVRLTQHEDYRESYNPSGREFCPDRDPYAAVVKSKKHMNSAYHDVSGLPDQDLKGLDEDTKPPQHGLSYDESLKSGYSNHNRRGRRVFRESLV